MLTRKGMSGDQVAVCYRREEERKKRKGSPSDALGREESALGRKGKALDGMLAAA